MSAQTFSTFAEVGMIDARLKSGQITLPLTTDIPYRILTLKDIYGVSGFNIVTLNTQGADVFEDGTTSRTLDAAYQSITLYAGQPGTWYIIGGSVLPTATIGILNVSTLTGTGISNLVSTLSLQSTVLGLTQNIRDGNYISSLSLQSTVQNLLTGGNSFAYFSTTAAAVFTTSTLQTSSITANYGFISTLTVNSLTIGPNPGYITMGDLVPTSLSTLAVYTGLSYAQLLTTSSINTQSLNVSSILFNNNTSLFVSSGSLLFNGSTVALQSQVFSTILSFATISTLSLQSTIIGLGSFGYISSGQLLSTTQGLSQQLTSQQNLVSTSLLASTVVSLGTLGYVSTLSLQSTVQGLGSSGYISSTQLISTTQSLSQQLASQQNLVSTSLLTSTVTSLGTLGYVSSPTLYSTILGLGSLGYISSTQLISTTQGLSQQLLTQQNLVSTSLLTSTVISLGSLGYISSTQLFSTTQGLRTYIDSFIDPVELTSTVIGLGTQGFVSSVGLQYSLVSTIASLGSVGYVSTTQLFSTSLGIYAAITSTAAGIGSEGYISSLSLQSTVQGLGTYGYVSSSQLISTSQGFTLQLASQQNLVSTSLLASTVTSLGTLGYVSTTQLFSTVQGLTTQIGTGGLLQNIISTPNLQSSLIGLGTFGYVSTTQLFSTVQGLTTQIGTGGILQNIISTPNLQSSLIGLGTFGYVSTTQLFSTVQGLTTQIGTGGLLQNIISTPNLQSSLIGLGTLGYISSSQLQSTTQGLRTYIDSFIDPVELTSTVISLGTQGFVSAAGLQYSLVSTIASLGSVGYVSTTQLFSTSLGIYGAITSNAFGSVGFVSTLSLSSTIQGLGTYGYISTSQLLSTTAGLTTQINRISTSQLVTGNYVVQGILNANQTITAGSDILVQFTTTGATSSTIPYYDPQGWWNNSTYRFQPTIPGYYQVVYNIWWKGNVSPSGQENIQIHKNGNGPIAQSINATYGNSQTISALLYLNGTSDYVDFTAYTSVQDTIQPNGSYFYAALQVSGGSQLTDGLVSTSYLSTIIASTVTSLGTQGYISSGQLFSTVQGLTTQIASGGSGGPGSLQNIISTPNLQSTVQGLGTLGYISTISLQSTVQGISTSLALNLTTSSFVASSINVGQATISSLVVNSISFGTTANGYIAMGDVITTSQSTIVLYAGQGYVTNLITSSINTGGLYTSSIIFYDTSNLNSLIVSSGNLLLNGSTMVMQPYFLSTLTSTLAGLGSAGYISSLSLQSTVQGLGSAGYVSSLSLQSTVQGLGSYGYISSLSLQSTIVSITKQITTTDYSSLTTSTVIGLGSFGYISTLSLQSTVQGITQQITTTDYSSITISTATGLGSLGYISSSQLQSTTQGLITYVDSFIDPVELTSTVIGLGTQGFVSSVGLQYSLVSTIASLGSVGYVSTTQLFSTSLGIYAAITSTAAGIGSDGYVSSLSLQSTVQGLGTYGYISTQSLHSTVQTINQQLISSYDGLVINLGTLGYISTAQLRSTVSGLTTIPFTGSTISLSAGSVFVSSVNATTIITRNLTINNGTETINFNGTTNTLAYGSGVDTLSIKSALPNYAGGVASLFFGTATDGYPLARIAGVDTSASAPITSALIFQTATATANAGLSGINIFPYTGSDQFYTVPSGVTSVTISMWAAGGGPGQAGGFGGGGAYVNASLSVTAGMSLRVIVGQGGSVGATSGYGGGGFGSGAASGGGRSAIQLIQTGIVTGASASGGTITYTTSVNHRLQAGQGFIISNLASGSVFNLSGIVANVLSPTSFTLINATTGATITGGSGTLTLELVDVGGGGGGPNCGGGAFSGSGGLTTGGSGSAETIVTGGTQTAAGSGGGGSAGTIFQAGGAGNGNGGYAGGGGGGFFPGGSGGSTSRAAGGGSSYLTYSGLTIVNSSAGAGTTPVGTGDTYYVSGISVGGASGGSPGGNGRVVIAAPPSFVLSESMRIANTGFVGIGTNAPQSLLHVSGMTYSLTMSTQSLTVSTINGSGVVTATNLISTFQGLGTAGYISTTQLQSTIQGLGTYGYLSTLSLQSTLQGLGNAGYVSSLSLQSTFVGISTTYALNFVTSSFTASTITAGTAFFSSLNVNSLSFGNTTNGYIAMGDVIATSISTLVNYTGLTYTTSLTASSINTGGLYTSSVIFYDTSNLNSLIVSSGNLLLNGSTMVLQPFFISSLQSTVTGLGSAPVVLTNLVSTSLLASTVASLGTLGYISTLSLQSTVQSLQINSGNFFSSFSTSLSRAFITSSLTASSISANYGFISSLTVNSLTIGPNPGYITMGDLVPTSLSTLAVYTGINYANYIAASSIATGTFFASSIVLTTGSTLVTTLDIQNFVSTLSLQSTVQGLGSFGYISSSQLFSTVTGLGGTPVVLSNLVSTSLLASTVASLGTLGYISTLSLQSTIQGLTANLGSAGYISSFSLQSTVNALGSLGYISSSQLLSTAGGLQNYISSILVLPVANTTGTVLYLNYSISSPPYSLLALAINSAPVTDLPITLPATTSNTPISQFQTGTQLPSFVSAGFWDINLFAYCSNLTDVAVYASLYTRIGGVETLIVTSDPVPINDAFTAQYAITLNVPYTNLPAGTSVVIKIFGNNTSGTSAVLHTLYEGNSYSHMHTSFGTILPLTLVTSTVDGLGTAGYVSSSGLKFQLQSTVVGLGSLGYISSSQLFSTTQGLQTYVDTFINTDELTSTIVGLGTEGFVSTTALSFSLASTVIGLGSIGYISSQQLLSTTLGIANFIPTYNYANTSNLFSTVAGLGTASYISSLSLQSTVRGLGTATATYVTNLLANSNFVTSNYVNTQIINLSNASASNYVTYNYLTATLSNLTLTGGGQTGDFTATSIYGSVLNITGDARALSFSTIYAYASNVTAINATIGTSYLSNIITLSTQASNLTIPAPAQSEWISFAVTPTGDTLLLRSNDTTLNWTTSPSPFIGGDFNAIQWNGLYWLTLGTDQNNKYSSAKSGDGLIWTTYPTPFISGMANSLGWNGSIWVAMGTNSNSSNAIATSSDGQNWTAGTSPFPGGQSFAIAWNNTIWLASGYSPSTGNTLAYSSDGINWISYVGPNFQNQGGYAGLAWNGYYWVLTGSDQTNTSTTATSYDGMNWQATIGPFTGGFGTSVVWGSNRFIATGINGFGNVSIGLSYDGVSWTTIAGPFVGGYGLTVKWNGTYFLASGYSATSSNVLSYSSDGFIWSGLGNVFDGKQILFATTLDYAVYPPKYSMTVAGQTYLSSVMGNWVDAQTIVVVDI